MGNAVARGAQFVVGGAQINEERVALPLCCLRCFLVCSLPRQCVSPPLPARSAVVVKSMVLVCHYCRLCRLTPGRGPRDHDGRAGAGGRHRRHPRRRPHAWRRVRPRLQGLCVAPSPPSHPPCPACPSLPACTRPPLSCPLRLEPRYPHRRRRAGGARLARLLRARYAAPYGGPPADDPLRARPVNSSNSCDAFPVFQYLFESTSMV